MEKKNTQWLKGFELLNKTVENKTDEIAILESLLETSLPNDIREYFEKYIPFDTNDENNFSDEVEYESDEMVFTGKLNKIKVVQIGPLYNINEIIARIERINHSTWAGILKKRKIIPIAGHESIDGDVVVSLEEDKMGKIYYLVDFQESPIDNTTLIADNIDDFINGMQVLPRDEADDILYNRSE